MLPRTHRSDNPRVSFFSSILHHGVLFLVSFLLTLQLAVRPCLRKTFMEADTDDYFCYIITFLLNRAESDYDTTK